MIDNLILISGRKQSGKDTFGNFFVEDNLATKFSFAGILKECCQVILHSVFCKQVSIDVFNDPVLKEQPLELLCSDSVITPRMLLQTFGTDFVKNCVDKNYWVNRLLYKIENEFKNSTRSVVIADTRFPDEIERCYEIVDPCTSIYTIRIERDTNLIDTHASETGFDNYPKDAWDFYIENNGSLDELYTKYLDIKKIIFGD